MTEVEIKRVFISYSWAVKERVKELADCLIKDGVEVVIDIYDLNKGDDKYRFMERSVNDDSIDRVLIICDKTYTDKANERSGGVGDETVIITPKLYGDKESNKFIPVVFEKDSDGNPYCPIYIKSRIYVDLSNVDEQESEYEGLLREIYNEPSSRRPALGKKPEYLNDEKYDYSVLRGFIRIAKNSKERRVNPLFIDHSVLIMKQLVGTKIDNCGDFIKTIEITKDLRDLTIDYCSALLPFDVSIVDLIIEMIEKLNNDIKSESDNEYMIDVIGFFIWELFISFVSLLFHYKKYEQLHDVLTHTFFIKQNRNWDCRPCDYSEFDYYSQILEEKCKPQSDNPRLITLHGDMLINRVHEPILTKTNLTNADLLLFHLYPMYHESKSWWFPKTYIYQCGPLELWSKIQSRGFCTEVMKLVEVDTIEELKNKISSNPYGDGRMRHNSYFRCAEWITNYVDINKIGIHR